MGETERGLASPYATGGGGVTLEHAYGAYLLAGLLQGRPVGGLGDDLTLREVRFQQAATCPVDDLVVVGESPTLSRVLYIGVRRNPIIAGGNAEFVTLLVNYLRMLVDRRAGFDLDGKRLALAVAAHHTGADEVTKLAFFARRQPNEASFRSALLRPKATSGYVRLRLKHLKGAVAAAAVQGSIALADEAALDDLTWRLLKSLRIVQLRLEGDDQADRTNVVGHLVSLAGGPAQAHALWDRLIGLSATYAQASAVVNCEMLARDLSSVIQLENSASALSMTSPSVSDEQMYERLRQLPPVCGPRLVTAWRDDHVQAWRLITALTALDVRPTELLRQWEAHQPGWLATASWQVQLAASELAAGYDARNLAASLLMRAAEQGVPRRSFWLARAAMIYDECGSDDDREGSLSLLSSASGTEELYADAVRAMLAGDLDTAVRIAEDWMPVDAGEEALRIALRLRLIEPVEPEAGLDRESLDRGLRLLDEALRHDWAPGFAVLRARLLILRARRGESANFDADLREARTIALRARDDRRTYRADSAEAVVLACHASALLMDVRRILELGAPGGEATQLEAGTPEVCQWVAIAAIQRGDLKLARQRAVHISDEAAKARIDAYLAQASGQDAEPHWRRAAELAGDNHEELAHALGGLAELGIDALAQYPDFARRNPAAVHEVRAQLDLTEGQPEVAIARLRSHRRSSITAALDLARAYQKAGRIADQVQTLRDAADDFGDRSLRYSAAAVLARTGSAHEAEQELDSLLASAEPSWSGRADALRLAAELAAEDGRHDRACDLLRTLLQIEPEDSTSRWALVRILLHRGDLNGAWRVLHEAPQPLEPSNTVDAKAWIQLHRRRGRTVETITGCLRLLLRFADDEQFAATVLMNVILPWPESHDLPEEVRNQLATELDQFFLRWPDSPHLQQIQTSDVDQLQADMIAMMRRTSDQQALLRRCAYAVDRGQLPLAMLAVVAGRSYAEVCLRGGTGVLVAHIPDQAEFTACLNSAEAAEDADIVIDTPTAAVLISLSAEVRTIALSYFSRVLTTDDVMVDALAAKDTLEFRPTGSMQYEEQNDAIRLHEISEDEADRLARAAAQLHDEIEQLTRRTAPAASRSFEGKPEAQLSTWASPLDLARSSQMHLWSDDPFLRVQARRTGVRATSTVAVIARLATTGLITPGQHEACIQALVRSRVGDFPLNEQRLLGLAENDNWDSTGVMAVLGRPTTWEDLPRAFDLYRRLAAQVQEYAPDRLADWLYHAVQGATARLMRPRTASEIAALQLITAIQLDPANTSKTVQLLAATRRALAAGDDPDGTPAADPLPFAITILRNAITDTASSERAAPTVIGMFADVEESDKEILLRALLE